MPASNKDDYSSADKLAGLDARQPAMRFALALPAGNADTATFTDAGTSDTCCPYGSPTASVQGPLCRKRPASPALTFDSQSTVTPAGKKLCYATTSYPKLPQFSVTALKHLHTNAGPGLSSLATTSYRENSYDKQLFLSSISTSEQRHSSCTAMDHWQTRIMPAFCSLSSACDDDEGIDEAESRFAAFPVPPLPHHDVQHGNRPIQSMTHAQQPTANPCCGNSTQPYNAVDQINRSQEQPANDQPDRHESAAHNAAEIPQVRVYNNVCTNNGSTVSF